MKTRTLPRIVAVIEGMVDGLNDHRIPYADFWCVADGRVSPPNYPTL